MRERLMTRQQAAEYLGLKAATLDKWAVTGRYGLPMVRVGRRVMYRKEDLDRWIDKRTVTHTGEAELLSH